MCGIVAYIGDKQASKIILKGLKRLEYRGYDSAGIALIQDSSLQLFKKKGIKILHISRLTGDEIDEGKELLLHSVEEAID